MRQIACFDYAHHGIGPAWVGNDDFHDCLIDPGPPQYLMGLMEGLRRASWYATVSCHYTVTYKVVIQSDVAESGALFISRINTPYSDADKKRTYSAELIVS